MSKFSSQRDYYKHEVDRLQAENEALRSVNWALKGEFDALKADYSALNNGSGAVAQAVSAEIAKAMRKFPTWPTDPLHAIAVLGEEFGELTKDVLQMVYEPHKTSMDNVRKEALQTAAMAYRFLASIDVYQFARCDQHEQQCCHVQDDGKQTA
ncbi:MAG: hypothetical protein ACRCWJ_14945 [Casimicrobium sp.]